MATAAFRPEADARDGKCSALLAVIFADYSDRFSMFQYLIGLTVNEMTTHLVKNI
jgi:hypothetical protein